MARIAAIAVNAGKTSLAEDATEIKALASLSDISTSESFVFVQYL
jgi:hypothetical protein